MLNSLRPRKAVSLSGSVQRRLSMYALGASTAGVSLFALAPPADAKVVYTPRHLKLHGGYTFIDLNHDGTGDFAFWMYRGHGSIATSFLAIYPGTRNAVITTGFESFKNAVAVKQGHRIGQHRLFDSGGAVGLMVNHVTQLQTSHHNSYWGGQWANGGKGLQDRYLGFRFQITDQVHYGWARVSVAIKGKVFTSTLTGYAYETIPNKGIIAGKTTGPDVTTLPANTGTLGHLALGRK